MKKPMFGNTHYMKKPMFGRKRSHKGSRRHKKPSKALIKMCKKHGIKCTRKVGGKRVYKKVSVLKRQLKHKKKLKKSKRSKSHFGKRRRSFFGF